MVEPMETEEFERRVLSFEQAWQGESSPAISDFLPASLVPEDRLRLLSELVCLDLEYRWRQSDTNHHLSRFQVEDYLHQFPELGRSPERVLELITEEYRTRHCWGDKPDHAEFLARFSEHEEGIASLLRRADQELKAEGETESSPRSNEGIIANSLVNHSIRVLRCLMETTCCGG